MKNFMNLRNSNYIFVATALLLALNYPALAHAPKTKLLLTAKDKRAIVQAVFADGFEELNAVSETRSILTNCPSLILHDEAVTFVSTKNIDAKFVPQISGIHFEFMSPGEIDNEVMTNDKHCYFEFTRFEVVGSKVTVGFRKCLKRPVYIYCEEFRYEFTKVSGKWQGKHTGSITIES